MNQKTDIYKLARAEITAMQAYSSARSEASDEGVLLNANESPWPLLPESHFNRYPQPQPETLVSRLANLYQVSPKHLLVTRGSDEGIDLLTRVFCRANKDAVIQCTPAFGMYAIAAQTQGVDIISIPRLLEKNFSMDTDKLLDAIENDARIKLIFLTTPNNPTGNSIPKQVLLEILAAASDKAIVVVDEAYIEFSAQDSFTPLILEHNNLVILRTLSKAWAGAGLRCGSVIAQHDVIDLLKRIIAPYPLASPVIELAERVLDPNNLKLQQRLLKTLATNKQRLLGMLKDQDYITDTWPGDANFILIRLNNAASLMRHCRNNNVSLRAFNKEPLLLGCIRISVGSDSDLDALEHCLNTWIPA